MKFVGTFLLAVIIAAAAVINVTQAYTYNQLLAGYGPYVRQSWITPPNYHASRLSSSGFSAGLPSRLPSRLAPLRSGPTPGFSAGLPAGLTSSLTSSELSGLPNALPNGLPSSGLTSGLRDSRQDRGPIQFPPGPPGDPSDTSGVVVGASGYGFVPPNQAFWAYLS